MSAVRSSAPPITRSVRRLRPPLGLIRLSLASPFYAPLSPLQTGYFYGLTAVQNFEAAAEAAKNFSKRPSNEELLNLYGLYKQATVGDNTTSAPWSVQFEAKAKWDAWTARKGLDQETAKEEYVKLVEELKKNYA